MLHFGTISFEHSRVNNLKLYSQTLPLVAGDLFGLFLVLDMADPEVKPESASPTNADEPEIEEDADIDMNIDPAATEKPAADVEMEEEIIEEPKEPTKKDVALRDFLAKMDDYAPIVREGSLLLLAMLHTFVGVVLIKTHSLDTRRSNLTPPPPRRPQPSHNASPTITTSSASNPKVYRRHSSRRLPILTNAIINIRYSCSSGWAGPRWAWRRHRRRARE